MTSQQTGFSLIELVVAMAIMAILIAMGLPSFSTYLANTKVRANAESVLSGLQTARTEALRQNTSVEFLFTSDIPNTSSVATNNVGGANWMVRSTPPVDATSYIDGKVSSESGGSRVTLTPSANSIIFNNLGAANPAATIDLAYIGDDCVADGGPIRCLRVQVSLGGRIRLCDPAATVANDTRGC